MKILAIADIEEPRFWEHWNQGRTQDIDLIISCGDLNPAYLEFLVTMTNRPLLYVRGNHDTRYDERPPEGAICIEDQVYDHNGLRILGLGGSMRYRQGKDMYTEAEMRRRVWKAGRAIRRAGGIDILVTHAPAKGYGDLSDLAHTGFDVFNHLLEKRQPEYMLHGHVHKNYERIRGEIAHPSGTRIINAYGHRVIEIPDQTIQ